MLITVRESKHTDLNTHINRAITGLMLFLPFMSLGAYSRLFPVMLIGGVCFGVMIKGFTLLPEKACRISSAVLRIAACIMIILYVLVIFGFGKEIKALYPVRKWLFISGNYSDSGMFDFFPDEIPDKADNFKMSFVPPTIGQDSHGNIEICFYTDSEGTAEFQKLPESLGAVKYSIDSKESSKLKNILSDKGYDCENTLAYVYKKNNYRTVYYAVNEDIGFCYLYW